MPGNRPSAPNGTVWWGRIAAIAILLLSSSWEAVAQERGAITLDSVIQATLRGNAEVETARTHFASARGALIGATSAFDPVISGTMASARDRSRGMLPSGDFGLADSRLSSYGLSAVRATRYGVVFQPELEVNRVAAVGGATGSSTATVGLGVAIPLLNDRWGSVSAVPERAASGELIASRLQVRSTIAASILSASTAFWNCIAAQQQLVVYQESEDRARQMADQTEILVQHDERPASDLNQLQANLAIKRMLRISAEEALSAARTRLGLAMGLPPAEIVALPPIEGNFPEVAPFANGDSAMARMLAMARENRPELASLAQLESAAALRVGAASDAMKPHLDLVVNLGYTGIQSGSGWDGLITPLYSNVPGLSSSIQLQFQLPVASLQARGERVQRAAALDGIRVAAREQERQVMGGVAISASALSHAIATLNAASSAVSLFQTTVDNETRKHELGASTLFDVIASQDGLTNARLAVVSSHLDYAVAIAQLRFQTGTLAIEQGGLTSVEPRVLLTPP